MRFRNLMLLVALLTSNFAQAKSERLGFFRTEKDNTRTFIILKACAEMKHFYHNPAAYSQDLPQSGGKLTHVLFTEPACRDETNHGCACACPADAMPISL